MAVRKKIEYSPEFLELKAIYPKRNGGNPWPRAFKAYNARIKEGYTHGEIKAGLMQYAPFCDAVGKTGTELVMQAATFFGPDIRWEDTYCVPKPKITDQFRGMTRDQQIEAKAKILHLSPGMGVLMHEWASKVNSEWLKRYPAH